MRVHINPFEPWPYAQWRYYEPQRGGFQVVQPVELTLGGPWFDGMDGGKLARLERGVLRHEHPGFWWDGSTMALNVGWSHMASHIHDAVCGAINRERAEKHITLLEWYRLRRRADNIYRDVCIAQGMWPAWAGLRYWVGLRFFGPAYTALCLLGSKMRH